MRYSITFHYLIFFKVNLGVSVDTAQVACLSKYRKLFLALWQAVKPLKITMTCTKRKNNALAPTYQWSICVYAVYAYVRICRRVCAYMHTHIRVLGWRALRVYFGSDIHVSELHCNHMQMVNKDKKRSWQKKKKWPEQENQQNNSDRKAVSW